VIYLCTEQLSEDAVARILPLLPQERRARALSYRFAVDRNNCVTAYALLMHGLRQEYGITAPPRLSYGELGKPSLTEHPSLFFSLTHTKSGVACAIAEVPLGIDLEIVAPVDPLVAQLVCTAVEQAHLARSTLPDQLFCKYWTLKEAHIKSFGGSIGDAPDEIESSELPYCAQYLESLDSFLCCTADLPISHVSWNDELGTFVPQPIRAGEHRNPQTMQLPI